eukprot:2997785-Pleurochrysis_carterae.AAC.1
MRLAADSVSPRSLAGEDEGSRLSSIGTAANSGTSIALACWRGCGVGHADERVGIAESQLRSQEVLIGLAPVRGVVGPEVVERALDRREEILQILPESRAAA